jgi:hypothetical protein
VVQAREWTLDVILQSNVTGLDFPTIIDIVRGFLDEKDLARVLIQIPFDCHGCEEYYLGFVDAGDKALF